jgi:hypothetical protein
LFSARRGEAAALTHDDERATAPAAKPVVARNLRRFRRADERALLGDVRNSLNGTSFGHTRDGRIGYTEPAETDHPKLPSNIDIV